METVIRLLDELDDLIVSTAFRLRRALAWTPKERRHHPRLDTDVVKAVHFTALSPQQ